MKANLPEQEPRWLEFWESHQIYQKILEKNKNAQPFILHDGPPYANGTIHFGHILNKVLKDIIIKQKNLAGYRAPFVPGWDCHGLPIELGALKNLAQKEKDPEILKNPLIKRQACREHALGFVAEQKKQFKRLGIFGDWNNPYLTLTNEYEAKIAKEFMDLYLNGYVVQAHKPVHFCISCQTALAEAEVEYENLSSPSIYVKFGIDGKAFNINKKTYFIIWTTTPWTLLANVAIAVGEKISYDAILHQDEVYLVASDLKKQFLKECGLPENSATIQTIDGEYIARLKINAQHPLINRLSKVVLGHHVTTESGTGVVHIAPGHGQDDYFIGQKEKLPTLCPVNERGVYFDDGVTFQPSLLRYPEVSNLLGQHILKANPQIISLLAEKNLLVSPANLTLTHSYPHCWRCKNPIIFRATEQWFCSLEHRHLREQSLKAIKDDVTWIPQWGQDRIYGMIEKRPDWCVSRQRIWGVPITLHKTEKGEVVLNETIKNFIVKAFQEKGADAWWETTEPLLPESVLKEYAGQTLQKESSILDVWFDSGVSHSAVLESRPELQFPADLYLEGSDQHRGWFHSSLLTSMANKDTPPYKAVLTHGFVVDGQGKKYSKSAKNYTPPEKIMAQTGAELLRLWVAAEDYRSDIRVSDEIFKVLGEIYRKIRNTYRFILGNLSEFDSTKLIEVEQRHELDQYALHLLNDLIGKINKAYENYEFHIVHHSLNKFFTVDLSAFYLDILKDRLYCDKNSARRLSAQSTLYDIVMATLPLLAPILSFTAEEIWSHFPCKQQNIESVFLLEWPTENAMWKRPDLAERYQRIGKIREDVLKQLEIARQNKLIGHGLDAKVLLSGGANSKALLNQYKDEWPQIFIVSQTEVSHEIPQNSVVGDHCPDLFIKIVKAEGEKCERCWNYSLAVGQSKEHPTLCARCVEQLS